MAQLTLGLAIGNELDNMKSKREERAVESVSYNGKENQDYI